MALRPFFYDVTSQRAVIEGVAGMEVTSLDKLEVKTNKVLIELRKSHCLVERSVARIK